MWRLRPALPIFTFSWSMLETWPMEAMQVSGTLRSSARGQPQQGHAVLLGHQLSHDAGGPGQLSALAGVQLHVVDEGAHRDVLQGQGVAGLDVGVRAGNHLVPAFRPWGARM